MAVNVAASACCDVPKIPKIKILTITGTIQTTLMPNLLLRQEIT